MVCLSANRLSCDVDVPGVDLEVSYDESTYEDEGYRDRFREAFAAGHHVFQPCAVLRVVNALRFAPTARSARPSGIDTACAQREHHAFT